MSSEADALLRPGDVLVRPIDPDDGRVIVVLSVGGAGADIAVLEGGTMRLGCIGSSVSRWTQWGWELVR